MEKCDTCNKGKVDQNGHKPATLTGKLYDCPNCHGTGTATKQITAKTKGKPK
jgi:DnaJ-class molecular chaperone